MTRRNEKNVTPKDRRMASTLMAKSPIVKKHVKSPWSKDALPGIGKKIPVPYPIYSSSSPVVNAKKKAAPRYFQEFTDPSLQATSLDHKPALPKIHPLDMNAVTRLGGNESAEQHRMRRNRIAKIRASFPSAHAQEDVSETSRLRPSGPGVSLQERGWKKTTRNSVDVAEWMQISYDKSFYSVDQKKEGLLFPLHARKTRLSVELQGETKRVMHRQHNQADTRVSKEDSMAGGRRSKRIAVEEKSTGITPTFRSLDVGKKGGTLLSAIASESDRGAISARLTVEQVLDFLVSEIRSRFAMTIPEPAELLERNREQVQRWSEGAEGCHTLSFVVQALARVSLYSSYVVLEEKRETNKRPSKIWKKVKVASRLKGGHAASADEENIEPTESSETKQQQEEQESNDTCSELPTVMKGPGFRSIKFKRMSLTGLSKFSDIAVV
ncbi:hypothetical protein GUITHDRAFT_145344 [Guillardia theta CCMP2712]|uniref:Uncharacterized protein n=1 Tax=Guillardia theta (strain CCMP2712) TaxID=905079 RepID=L1IL52_GUITC|nr:hypothetical protein GUITHDRAFT_145344 [Guillardia theta CCMP2712]EKX36988.1 hypothetical protein GUITHDRAFT_145344 [Guillardia theta CCMP2712]|eukprot:XP_005823968.1 hypothetical protein GUITHDRAFT_145344 [Guillardia theta CCMP2712]